MRVLAVLVLLALAAAPATALDAEVDSSIDPAPDVGGAVDVDVALEADPLPSTPGDLGVAADADLDASYVALDADGVGDLGAASGLEATGDGLDVSVEAASESSDDAPASERAPEPAPSPSWSEPTPHSDIIDDPAPQAPWSEPEAMVRAAAVAVPLATVGAAAVVAALQPAATGRLLARLPRWLLWLPAWGLFSRIHDRHMDDQPTRAAIMQFVAENPGASINEVRAALDVAWGTAVYHLRRLEDAEHLVSERDGRLHRYWVRDAPVARHRDAQRIVLSDTPRALLAAVAARPGSRQKELCATVGVSAPVASKYLTRMARHDLVEVAVAGRDRHYFLGSEAVHVAHALAPAVGALQASA